MLFLFNLLYCVSKKNSSKYSRFFNNFKDNIILCIFVYFANAFINDVLPVHGGPHNLIPNV